MLFLSRLGDPQVKRATALTFLDPNANTPTKQCIDRSPHVPSEKTQRAPHHPTHPHPHNLRMNNLNPLGRAHGIRPPRHPIIIQTGLLDLIRIVGQNAAFGTPVRRVGAAADGDGGAVVVHEGRAVAVVAVCLRAQAASAPELVDHVCDVGGFGAAAGALACHAVLAG